MDTAPILTADEIAERVRRSPELARKLFVHTSTQKLIVDAAQTVPGLNWHGVNIVIDPLLPADAMVWVDRNGEVLAVQRIAAIDH